MLLVGEQGVGKTTLIVEALRRLGARVVRVPGERADVNAGQSYVGELEGRVREIVGRMSRRSIVWLFPSFEEALCAGQHTQQPARAARRHPPASRRATSPSSARSIRAAYELLAQNRPR